MFRAPPVTTATGASRSGFERACTTSVALTLEDLSDAHGRSAVKRGFTREADGEGACAFVDPAIDRVRVAGPNCVNEPRDVGLRGSRGDLCPNALAVCHAGEREVRIQRDVVAGAVGDDIERPRRRQPRCEPRYLNRSKAGCLKPAHGL